MPDDRPEIRLHWIAIFKRLSLLRSENSRGIWCWKSTALLKHGTVISYRSFQLSR